MDEPEFKIEGPRGAVLSRDRDRRHRYWLWRIWDRARPILVVCMFNPSTANARDDDPTIRRLCAWARRWGYGGILVVNLLSIRTSDPREARAFGRDAYGPAQAEAIAGAIMLAQEQGTPILAAWGANASAADAQLFLAPAEGFPLICLGRCAGGQPKHPMARGRSRIPDDQEPLPWAV
jgi:hypothetical protein